MSHWVDLLVYDSKGQDKRYLLSNGPVQKPVGGRGHGQGLGPDLEGEDLASDDPRNRTPRACKEENIDTDEGDQSLLRCKIVDSSDSTRDSNDELANTHADGAKEEKVAAAPGLNHIQTRERGQNVDGRGNHTDDKGVSYARILEE